ncbi:MAG TPA: response regulator transcription factor [Polyangiales bacterium]
MARLPTLGSMRMLVVDDDADVRDLLVRALERDGHSVRAVGTSCEARIELARGGTDVMVLDYALPDGTGIELCRRMRELDRPPAILMLTAHGEVARRVRALDAGADDFLSKPFAIAELRARVRALGRRTERDRERPRVLSTAQEDTQLDIQGRLATRAGVRVALTAREWVILEALAARPRRCVSRARLLALGWDDDGEASAASLEVLIGRIRRKLGEGLIRTQRGEGYVLEAE